MRRATTNDRFDLWTAPGVPGLELLRGHYHDHTFAPHAHDTWVIQIVEAGVNEFDCAGRRYTARAGDVVLIEPGAVHTGRARGEEPLSYRAIYAKPDSIGAGTPAPAGPPRVVALGALADQVRAAFGILRRERDPLAAETALAALTRAVSRAWRANTHDDSPVTPSEHTSVRRARELIQSRFLDKLSLEDLGREAGLSPCYLLRLFQRAYGCSPLELILTLRVEHARRLIRDGEDLSRVATASGFCDQSHLNRHFKRIVGVTPGRYRDPARA